MAPSVLALHKTKREELYNACCPIKAIVDEEEVDAK